MQLRGGFSLLLLSCAAFLGVTAQQNATQNVSMAGNQTTTTVDPLANLPPSLQNCPQWLYDYVRWHKQQRSNESAFRVTWSDERGGRGMGYGDRLRGAVHGLKSAASSARRADRLGQCISESFLQKIVCPTLFSRFLHIQGLPATVDECTAGPSVGIRTESDRLEAHTRARHV